MDAEQVVEEEEGDVGEKMREKDDEEEEERAEDPLARIVGRIHPDRFQFVG